jgi:hypothetical protein
MVPLVPQSSMGVWSVVIAFLRKCIAQRELVEIIWHLQRAEEVQFKLSLKR